MLLRKRPTFFLRLYGHSVGNHQPYSKSKLFIELASFAGCRFGDPPFIGVCHNLGRLLARGYRRRSGLLLFLSSCVNSFSSATFGCVGFRGGGDDGLISLLATVVFLFLRRFLLDTWCHSLPPKHYDRL